MTDNDKEYWLQFRLKAIKDFIRFELSNMIGKIICEHIRTKEIDWTIRNNTLKNIMEDIEKWGRQKHI